jgi:hypothetical protein
MNNRTALPTRYVEGSNGNRFPVTHEGTDATDRTKVAYGHVQAPTQSGQGAIINWVVWSVEGERLVYGHEHDLTYPPTTVSMWATYDAAAAKVALYLGLGQ